MTKQSPSGDLLKDVLENFATFTKKHLCWEFHFNKVAGLPVKLLKFLRTLILKNIF